MLGHVADGRCGDNSYYGREAGAVYSSSSSSMRATVFDRLAVVVVDHDQEDGE